MDKSPDINVITISFYMIQFSVEMTDCGFEYFSIFC